jgi:tetratricopeptide (TPR) repeat protein
MSDISMNSEVRFAKVEIYLKQKNHSKAEAELSEMLSLDPNDPYIFIYFAHLYQLKNDYAKANIAIDNAISLSPNLHQAFRMKSEISFNQQNFSDAENYIRTAIELDPNEASYLGFLAEIKIQKKQYNDALEISNRALSINAEDSISLNARSQALVKLNRSPEAFQTIEGALRNDPNDAYTHANYGWSLLEQGDNKKAQIHFREALSRDPDFEYARDGMTESLKSSYFIYRLFLKYSFFINKQTATFQWSFLFGYLFLVKVLRTIAKEYESLQWFLYPIIGILGILAFSTWIIKPISNLILKLHPFGIHLLTKKEKWSSNLVGGSVFVFFVGIVLSVFTKDLTYLSLSIVAFGILPPVGNMFQKTRYPKLFPLYTCFMFGVGIISILISFSEREFFNVFTFVYVLMFVGFTWMYNYFAIGQNR